MLKNISYFTSNIPTLALEGLWGWALQGVSGVGHSRKSLGWALQGDCEVVRLWGLCGWALQGVSGLGTQGWHLGSFLGGWVGWALQQVSRFGVGHSRETLGDWGILTTPGMSGLGTPGSR